VVVAASNKGAITYTFPHMLNELLGTKFKIVSGYQGNSRPRQPFMNKIDDLKPFDAAKR
jgi:hypothetical protein